MPAAVPGMPPGRAGRVWVRGRLQAAHRGTDLLDRKLRILVRLEADLRVRAGATRADWERCCREAQEWSLRAALLGGQHDMRLAAETTVAQVDVSWTTTMGIPIPAGAECEIHARDGGGPGPVVSAAVTTAAAAHGRAIQAAARHAAAAAALRRISREVAFTRRRLRAIERRWTPRLEAASADLENTLEQQEREDGARLRRALGSVAEHRL